MPESTEALEPAVETWTCTGARVGSKERRVTAWMMPDGAVARFPGRESYLTGGLYEVTVSRPDGGVTMHGKPRYTGNRVADRTKLNRWRAEEVGAEAYLAAQAAERKHKAEDPLDELLEPLVAVAAGLRKTADRDAFLAHVTRHIAVAAWGRRS